MTKLRPVAWHTGRKRTSSMMINYISVVYHVYSNDAFPLRKVWCYFSDIHKEYVDITLC
jgi:hypothetical protein